MKKLFWISLTLFITGTLVGFALPTQHMTLIGTRLIVAAIGAGIIGMVVHGIIQGKCV